MSSEAYHEPLDALTAPTKNVHRAIVSLMEELEAVDWYQQRAEACTDDELRSVLIHNKNEEIEHAMMVLEWLRRNVPEFDLNVRTYLMKEGPITEIEANEKKAAGAAGAMPASGGATSGNRSRASGTLGIGSLKVG